MTLYQRFEKLSEEDSATRRRFLSRAAKACLGVAVAAAGLSRVEAAHAGARMRARAGPRLARPLDAVAVVLAGEGTGGHAALGRGLERREHAAGLPLAGAGARMQGLQCAPPVGVAASSVPVWRP